MNLLIAESPGKIKKLKKILGNSWLILASMGHFRTLYLLIWKRAISSSSQCRPALIDKTTLFTQSGAVTWKAKGQVVKFHGYAKYWPNLSADCQLPSVNQNQPLTLTKADLEQKPTSPPSRFGEAQLIALMEKKGIGRPSIYSSAVRRSKVALTSN